MSADAGEEAPPGSGGEGRRDVPRKDGSTIIAPASAEEVDKAGRMASAISGDAPSLDGISWDTLGAPPSSSGGSVTVPDREGSVETAGKVVGVSAPVSPADAPPDFGGASASRPASALAVSAGGNGSVAPAAVVSSSVTGAQARVGRPRGLVGGTAGGSAPSTSPRVPDWNEKVSVEVADADLARYADEAAELTRLAAGGLVASHQMPRWQRLLWTLLKDSVVGTVNRGEPFTDLHAWFVNRRSCDGAFLGVSARRFGRIAAEVARDAGLDPAKSLTRPRKRS